MKRLSQKRDIFLTESTFYLIFLRHRLLINLSLSFDSSICSVTRGSVLSMRINPQWLQNVSARCVSISMSPDLHSGQLVFMCRMFSSYS